MRDAGCAVRSHIHNRSKRDCAAHLASRIIPHLYSENWSKSDPCDGHVLEDSAHLLLHSIYKEMNMRTKIISVLFFLLIMSTFVVAQNSTGSSGTGSTSGNTGAATGSSTSPIGSNSFLSSPSSSGVQIPTNSGIGNAPISFTTPSTSVFNSQNLNSPSAIDSSSGTPTTDQILSNQSDLISSTNSFLNPIATSTSNTRTTTSALGETIFGDTLVPGMTNIPIVTVVPSTNPLMFETTTTNPQNQ